MKKLFFVVSIIILAGTALVYGGWFPAASVNGDWIWQRDMKKSAGAIMRLQETSSGAGLPSLTGTTTLSTLNASAIRRGALEELIYEKIIAQELKLVDSSQDWDERIARDTEGLFTGKDISALEKAARELYALNLNDFKRLVLAPQIREELLRKEIALRAKDPETWLENAFANAKIKIYFLDYRWQDGKLIEK